MKRISLSIILCSTLLCCQSCNFATSDSANNDSHTSSAPLSLKKGQIQLHAIDKDAIQNPRLYVADKMSMAQQFPFKEASSIFKRYYSADRSMQQPVDAQVSAAVPASETYRQILEANWGQIPEPTAKTFELSEELHEMETASGLISQYQNHFSQIRPIEALKDIAKLRLMLSQDLAAQKKLAEQAVKLSANIDFFGISTKQDEETTATPKENPLAPLQAQVDLAWLSYFEQFLVGIEREMMQETGLIQAEEVTAEGNDEASPQEAWQDYLESKGHRLFASLNALPSQTLESDFSYEVEREGTLILGFDYKGETFYIVEGAEEGLITF